MIGSYPQINVSLGVIDECKAMFNKRELRWIMISKINAQSCILRTGIYILYPSAEISAELSFVSLPLPSALFTSWEEVNLFI